MNNKKAIYIIIGILVAAIVIYFVAKKYMVKPTPAEKAGGTGTTNATSTKKWEVLKDVPSGLTAEKGSKVVIDGITYEYNGTQWGRYL